MRKANQEIKEKEIIDQILSQSTICRIAMIDGGVPYILPFNYGYKENCIYLHAATQGKKLDVLSKNNIVGFEIEDGVEIIESNKACSYSTKYRSFTGNGEIEIITDYNQKCRGLEIIMAQHGDLRTNTFEKKQVDAVVILKLNIKQITGKKSSNWDKIQSENQVDAETERLYLKEITWDDLKKIHELHSIPEVDEFNCVGIPNDINETKGVLRHLFENRSKSKRDLYTWKIIRKDTDEFIGLAGMILSNDKFKLGEIYYKLNPDHWGQGFATETAKRLIALGFDTFGLHKVEAGVATQNLRSIKVLEKCGMVREGLRRKILPIRGQWVDNYHYAIVEDGV